MHFLFRYRILLILLLALQPLFVKGQWQYIQIDSTKQKWGDWASPEWLRYFGLDAGDVNKDGCVDILSGRYIYHNPCGDMTGHWDRSLLDDNVDGILLMNVDDDAFADIIAMALPDIYWYEAIDLNGTKYRRQKITQVPATSHVNSQGFEKAQIMKGGKPEILIAGNGDIYCIEIPESPSDPKDWPTHLICKNTSDEGIGFGDIDGDGNIDIAAGRRPEGENEPLILVWFKHPGSVDQAWPDTEVGHSLHPIDRIAIADLNGDQKADIIATEERYPGLEPDGNFYWFEQGSNTNTWKKHIIVTQYSMNNLDIADLDNDGDLDLLTNEHKGPSLELQWWQNDGKGSFKKNIIDVGKENHLGTQLVDLDHDGDLDIIGSAWDKYQFMHLWRNDIITAPKTGDVFREYPWAPTQVRDKGKFLRVGGKLHYADTPEHLPDTAHKEGALPLPQQLDLDHAIKAEVILERVQSHEDTRNLQIRFNNAAWLKVPDPSFIEGKATDYMFHHSPTINIPLDHLRSGKGNSFEFKVDKEQSWNWPQNLIYGMVLRIYYEDSSTAIIQPKLNISQQSPDHYTLTLKDFKTDYFERYELIAHYKDVHRSGDGRLLDWQSYYHRGQLKNMVCSGKAASPTCTFQTSNLPNQDEVIRFAVRLHDQNGSIHFVELNETIALQRQEERMLISPYLTPDFWVTRSGQHSQEFYLPIDPSEVTSASLYWRSWSPCYFKGMLINGRTAIAGSTSEEKKWPCYDYAEHHEELSDPSVLKQGSNTLSTLKTPLHNGEMVHGMEVQWPGVLLKINTKKQDPPLVRISEADYEGRPHFVVHTPNATYYMDQAGGGFSRIIDVQGNDWINFKMKPWNTYPAAAASSFRGLPNLVFQSEDGGAGHPGHDKCASRIVDENKIIVDSKSKKWQWQYTFTPHHVKLDVLQTDPNQPYWFLYEGTPGGVYQSDAQYFGSNLSGPIKELPDFYKGNSILEKFNWAYFGHQSVDRVLYFIHNTPDQKQDILGYLGNSEKGLESEDGMTVFGFGRGDSNNPLLIGKNSFTIGFYPQAIRNEDDQERLAKYLSEQ